MSRMKGREVELESAPMLIGVGDSSSDPALLLQSSGMSQSRNARSSPADGSAAKPAKKGKKSKKNRTGEPAKKGKESKKNRAGDPTRLPRRAKKNRTGGDTGLSQGGLVISGANGWDADGMLDQGDGAGGAGAQTSTSGPGVVWKYVMYGLVIGPWKFVRGLGWCLNRWQRVCRPISTGLFQLGDVMDKHMPTVHAFCVWFWNLISLALHFVSVILTFSVAHLLYSQQRTGYAVAIVLLYIWSHYLTGVIMYMEMDRITHSGRYTFPEFLTFLQRIFEALFWDLQLLVSLVHSNCMLEGLTQMLLKGFEEARVCIHVLVNTLPMCIMLGVLYDKVATSWISFDLDQLQSRRYQDQIWVALVFSVLNALEKWIRLSLADPWLHPDLDDCFPLAFMRSNAARLPRGLMLEWLFRCNLQLTQQEDELVLRNLFSVYTFNCKGDARELCDGHKAYLLRKALRTFNGSGKIKVNKAEIIARRLDKSKFRNPRTIRALDASDIHPGRYMSAMLADVLGDSIGYSALNLANNKLGSANVAQLVDGLRANRVLQLRVLILNNNNIGEQGCLAVAKLVADSRSLSQLMLSGNPLGDAGVRLLAEALSGNRSLVRLDLADVEVGSESGSSLGAMIKANASLVELCLRGVKLGPAGVEALSKGLRANTGLQTLDISATGADDKAANALAQCLSSNKTLTRLDLSHTLVTDEGAKALCDAMQYNTTLQVCELAGSMADRSWMKLMNNIVSGRTQQGNTA